MNYVSITGDYLTCSSYSMIAWLLDPQMPIAEILQMY